MFASNVVPFCCLRKGTTVEGDNAQNQVLSSGRIDVDAGIPGRRIGPQRGKNSGLRVGATSDRGSQ